jgi:hypothetical protein
MTAVAAFMITVGIFASVASGATASAFGVKTKPVRICTPSRVISSCASRLATSGLGPVLSRRMISILVEPTLSPFCFIQSLMPSSMIEARLANGPV